MIFISRHPVIPGNSFVCHDLGGRVLLKSSGQRKRMLPQCTGQPSTTKNYLAEDVIVLRLRNPDIKCQKARSAFVTYYDLVKSDI